MYHKLNAVAWKKTFNRTEWVVVFFRRCRCDPLHFTTAYVFINWSNMSSSSVLLWSLCLEVDFILGRLILVSNTSHQFLWRRLPVVCHGGGMVNPTEREKYLPLSSFPIDSGHIFMHIWACQLRPHTLDPAAQRRGSSARPWRLTNQWSGSRPWLLDLMSR